MINHYGWTKAQAEKDALDADGSTLADGRTMATCAVRPCSGIFGHDDRMIIQRLVSEAPPALVVSREGVGGWRMAVVVALVAVCMRGGGRVHVSVFESVSLSV